MIESEFEFANEIDVQTNVEPVYMLAELEVCNWGPFSGKHRCSIDPEGSAIIGPTGSGKTTLIDALMTLLAPYPKYNLASTGGHESDRDLISYVRGVSGVESTQGEKDHVARPGNTITGLAASYKDGSSRVTLGALLWVEDSSNAADDLKKIWFFAKDHANTLDNLLSLHNASGRRAILQHARETVGLRLFSSKREYLAQVRSFFEVSENAFLLLNRAAGLKQLNSINQIFRELVLDDSSMFDRALAVAAEFDTLQGIYAELETARRQQNSLLPIEIQQVALERVIEVISRRQRLRVLLPNYFADAAVRLWAAELHRLKETMESIQRRIIAKETEIAEKQKHIEALQQRYLQLGGAAVQELEGSISVLKERCETTRSHALNYKQFIGRFGLPDDLTETVFRNNLVQLRSDREAAQQELETVRDETTAADSQVRQHETDLASLKVEINEVKNRPHSNIPTPQQTFREALADHLNVPSEQIPFVAELVEVKPEENRWRGAIERAVGPERLRILVSTSHMEQALAWINHRDNRLHVRLQQADESHEIPHPFDDGFYRKLHFKKHVMEGNVRVLIAKRDRHCVETTEELRRIDHAVTPEGTISDRGGRFEKQDQRSLSEGWMTGFDNTYQLKELTTRLSGLEVKLGLLKEKRKTARTKEEGLRQLLTIRDQLLGLEFKLIDLPKTERELTAARDRLNALTRPDSETVVAKHDFEAARNIQNDLRQEEGNLRESLGASREAMETAEAEHKAAQQRQNEGISQEEVALAAKFFRIPQTATAPQIVEFERNAVEKIDQKIRQAEMQRGEIERRLVREMEAAKREDTGALAETGTEIRDVPAFLERLKILRQEALPEKLRRFLEYLNTSSGQGVTQLLTNVEHEVATIEERVRDLNTTLNRVDFHSGRFLQLEPVRISHDAIRQLDSAHSKLRFIALHVNDDEGEAHYKALGEVIRIIREAGENCRTLASQALLDPRHRLQFFVKEIDRATGQSYGRRTGSQTGSGGEKEMMASYILTASLSYALCPLRASKPRYATIVLDEAFSKSSPAAASRIIEALRVFGLHPLFVTPNKEIALLKAHTRSAILVHNKNRRATLTSLTWEQIAGHNRNNSQASS